VSAQCEHEEREKFYHALDVRRRSLRKSWTEVCAEAGVAPSVSTRLGRGLPVLSDSVFRLSAWLHATKQEPKQPMLIEPRALR
jgi:hypothetical protein